MHKQKARGLINWVKTSLWVFPAVLLVLLVTLSALKISGTSVGTYHQALYGLNAKDPNLIYGHPQAIRSDEWLGGTQLLVSQSKNDFPKFNKDIGSGTDLSLQPDMPIRDWSTIFKPHNWTFFILPIENAFAFRWWILLYLLIVGCYFFTLRILPERRLFAASFSIAIGLSPFELWWYQSGAFLTIAYSFLIMILAMRILNGESARFIENKYISYALHAAALAYILVCFALIFYPPFQIPCAVVVLFFVLGLLAKKIFQDQIEWKTLSKRVGLLLLALAASAIVGIAFIKTRSDVFHSLGHTLYPGSRSISSGGLNPLKVFDGFIQFQLQSGLHGPHFMANQSEDSNFILFMPFLIIPGVSLIIYEYRKRKRIDWLLAASLLVGVLFLARAFIPFGDPLYKLLLLQRVPNERLIIGMGLAGILQLLYILKKLGELKPAGRKYIAGVIGYSFLILLFLLYIGWHTTHSYPLFIQNFFEIGVLAVGFILILLLFLSNRRGLAVTALMLFTLASSFRILPLYRGLGFDLHNSIVDEIQKISGPNNAWGAVDIPLFQNIGMLAGEHSITGAVLYPNLNFWRQVGGKQYDYVFNREAHAMLTADPTLTQPVRLVQRNFYEIKLSCNSEFIKNNINFALSIKPIDLTCAQLAGTVHYPELTVYLYKLSFYN